MLTLSSGMSKLRHMVTSALVTSYHDFEKKKMFSMCHVRLDPAVAIWDKSKLLLFVACPFLFFAHPFNKLQ